MNIEMTRQQLEAKLKELQDRLVSLNIRMDEAENLHQYDVLKVLMQRENSLLTHIGLIRVKLASRKV